MGTTMQTTHTFTINVGDSVRLDAKTTGYIKAFLG